MIGEIGGIKVSLFKVLISVYKVYDSRDYWVIMFGYAHSTLGWSGNMSHEKTHDNR